jgi:RNA polymerase primary sigma factor
MTPINKAQLLQAVFGKAEIPPEQLPPDDAIKQALSTLTERQRFIIERRFGEPPMTLREIGLILGVTGERVRRIEAKILRKLRHPSRSKFLKIKGLK